MAISLEISTHCNRTCYYCPQSINRLPKGFMSLEVFELCLRRLKEIKWSGVIDYAHFNEPLLDPRIISLVSRTKQVLPVSKPRIYTNGDRLTPDLVEKLIKAGVMNFAVTRHDLGEDEWNATIVPLAKQFPDYFTLAVIHGFPISNRGGLIVDSRVNVAPKENCFYPSAALHISSEGDVMLCGCDYDHSHTFGNVADAGLLEIWSRYALLRSELRKGITKLEICRKCFKRE